MVERLKYQQHEIRIFSSFPIVIIGNKTCVLCSARYVHSTDMRKNEAKVFDVIEQDGVLRCDFLWQTAMPIFFVVTSRDRIWLQHSFFTPKTQPVVSVVFCVGTLFVRPYENNKILKDYCCVNVVKLEFTVNIGNDGT
mmetsp:Transcript_20772/g.31564  ORF Transcript_20772/g.31564 Transcript_20772/m.31564 type:complete len:138 (+) Transcript_20772:61-474(+)